MNKTLRQMAIVAGMSSLSYAAEQQPYLEDDIFPEFGGESHRGDDKRVQDAGRITVHNNDFQIGRVSGYNSVNGMWGYLRIKLPAKPYNIDNTLNHWAKLEKPQLTKAQTQELLRQLIEAQPQKFSLQSTYHEILTVLTYNSIRIHVNSPRETDFTLVKYAGNSVIDYPSITNNQLWS